MFKDRGLTNKIRLNLNYRILFKKSKNAEGGGEIHNQVKKKKKRKQVTKWYGQYDYLILPFPEVRHGGWTRTPISPLASLPASILHKYEPIHY